MQRNIIHTYVLSDLAVIFRPALIAHPNHELSPQEHQLSQDVLEFLIAHQDWFMLDIPPPPAKSDHAVHLPAAEAVDMVPSSDDEQPGGWKLVSRDVGRHRITRRRTTTERSAGESSKHDSIRGCWSMRLNVVSWDRKTTTGW